MPAQTASKVLYVQLQTEINGPDICIVPGDSKIKEVRWRKKNQLLNFRPSGRNSELVIGSAA